MLKSIINASVMIGTITIGLMKYSEKKNYDALLLLDDAFKELEKRDVRRYTKKELDQVVGRISFENWTNDQVEQLDQMYQERRRKCHQHWDKLNQELEEDKQKHPEKYSGLLDLVRYGTPDIYSTCNDPEDRYEKIYQAYQISDEPIDNNYQEWRNNQKIHFHNYTAKRLSEMIVDEQRYD